MNAWSLYLLSQVTSMTCLIKQRDNLSLRFYLLFENFISYDIFIKHQLMHLNFIHNSLFLKFPYCE